ncbi:MAG: transketolase [Proteobacteria bacterium]|nr:MAG: transketolase [Pseudomonadota bacterium]
MKNQKLTPEVSADQVRADYRLALVSREASLLGRKEVLSGKAKFGIFGDGKELAQIALAKVFEHGDWRSGYYRDQTLMMAVGALTVRQFFAQLYADTDIEREPASGGRQMNAHFATRSLNVDGSWKNQLEQPNTSADASPTAAQMGRLLGLAYASKYYRAFPGADEKKLFSKSGREIAFGTIGNASTSEGIFWETLNAAGVLDVPMVMSVWDDGYGISVPNKFQTTKESISRVCAGFAREKDSNGFHIYTVRGWNYSELVHAYRQAADNARAHHIPALIHVVEISQPQGHSTSGSHERYKSKDRLSYESSIDCLSKTKEWMIEQKFADDAWFTKLEDDVRGEVLKEREAAWQAFQTPILSDRDKLVKLYETLDDDLIKAEAAKLKRSMNVSRKSILQSARRIYFQLGDSDAKHALAAYISQYKAENAERYNSFLHVTGDKAALSKEAIAAQYEGDKESVDGRVIIQRCFDHHLDNDPRIFIVGEDIGQLGGVNLEFEGLSEKHGDMRVTDTGIREASIFGQGLGASLRGLRPIVDIQYLDYLLYAFQLMSDDLASLHYRTAGGQIAPVIVRTKGHRLEGVWHSGSPMGMIIHGLRGIHVCVPRNMVQAAGMYNTLLASEDPALVVEVLNGYRVKEDVPSNLSDFRVPLGIPEVLKEGKDITLVTYGACVAVAKEAMTLLEKAKIDVELIDVQTLLPFDRHGVIGDSVHKTNLVLFLDEDVPGGATSYMMQEVLENQGAYEFLDGPPRTLTAKAHRSPYGSDGDYFTKPSAEDIYETIYGMISERSPDKFPPMNI